MKSKKSKKHSGRYTPTLHSKIPFSEMIEECLEPEENYDDWVERRDGMRDLDCLERKNRDKKKFPYKRGGRKRK